MTKKSKKTFVITAIAISLSVGFIALVINNYKTKTSFKYNSQSEEELKPEEQPQDVVSQAVIEDAKKGQDANDKNKVLKIVPGDMIIGENDAPVTVFEYASLSCPHCAAFYRETFEKLKEDYIVTGKVKFVFRHFPLNQSALTAAMFVECEVQKGQIDPNKYHSLLKALFKTQDSWAFDQKYDEKLEAIAKLDGVSSEKFQACIKDRGLQEKILSARMEASKSLQIKSVPTFFINGESSEGYVDYETIKRLIEKKLSEVK